VLVKHWVASLKRYTKYKIFGDYVKKKERGHNSTK